VSAGWDGQAQVLTRACEAGAFDDLTGAEALRRAYEIAGAPPDGFEYAIRGATPAAYKKGAPAQRRMFRNADFGGLSRIVILPKALP